MWPPSRPEAAYLAAFLAASDPSRAYALAASGLEAVRRVGADGAVRSGCPLYAGDTPYHCTVYEARPLICRMFAFSAVRNKSGFPEFSLCGLMPESAAHAGLRSIGPADPLGFGSVPPVMADHGSRVLSIDPDAANGRRPLPEALEDALSKVLFLAGVRQEDRDDDPGAGPDSSPPLPNAG